MSARGGGSRETDRVLTWVLPCPSIDPSDRIGCRSNLYIFTFLELIILFKTPFCVFILIVN